MNLMDDDKLVKFSERYAIFRDFYQFCVEKHQDAVIAFLKREEENRKMITKVRDIMQDASTQEKEHK